MVNVPGLIGQKEETVRRHLVYTRGYIALSMFALSIALFGLVMPVRAAEPGMAKVVWHVDFDSPRRLSAMIQNVNNMVTTYQGDLQDYDVRIVFLAGGIRFVTEDPLKGTPFAEDAEFRNQRPELIQRLKQLRELHNVKLELCEITREAIALPKSKIIAGVNPVRSGVVRIAELQAQGFSYLKVE
jgi:intracellular sulfur oxidation DsrE/DsrF family protein